MKAALLEFYHELPTYASLLLRGRLGRTLQERRAYVSAQRGRLAELKRQAPQTPVLEELVDRSASGIQRASAQTAQFWYASNAIGTIKPHEVHDIGSHRSWLLGMAASLTVHSVDVRRPEFCASNEVFHQGQGERLPFPDNSVECLTSLSSIEHFGLGSYGDPFDPQADASAAAEIVRVLRPGGHLVLTTLCTGRAESFVVFNTRRVYSLARIREMLTGLSLLHEAFFSTVQHRLVDRAELQTAVAPYAWDMYLSTWRKPA